MAWNATRIEGRTPHPVPLPLGEGTQVQRLRRDSLSQGERAGVRGSEPGFTVGAQNISVISCEGEG